MADRIFLTGVSGFVGQAVLRALLERGFSVSALVNRKPIQPSDDRVRSVPGGVFDDRAIEVGIKDCRAAIHLIGIIRENVKLGVTFTRMHLEASRRVIDAAIRAGVKRYIHMSALGTRPDAASEYHQTKWQAEQYLRGTSLDWTIFRPSLIHGPGGDFMQMEAAWARGTQAPFLFMPYFGPGLLGRGRPAKLQPVDVRDVARAFVEAIDNPRSIRQTYDLGGAQIVTWPEMHRIASSLIRGKPRRAIPIPAWYARLLTAIAPARLLPFNRAQVIMALEDNVGDNTAFVRDFGWTPQGFEPALRRYACEL
jgi:NADH dehydrogenase